MLLNKVHGEPTFNFFFRELPVPPQAAGVVGHFIVLFTYHSELYGLFFSLRMPYYFNKVSSVSVVCVA